MYGVVDGEANTRPDFGSRRQGTDARKRGGFTRPKQRTRKRGEHQVPVTPPQLRVT